MQVACPRCNTAVEWSPQSLYRPFCSERCKSYDLGAWATEKYVIPGAAQDENLAPEDENK